MAKKKDNVVYKLEIYIHESDIKTIIAVVNINFDGKPLTLKEVVQNPKLLEYLVESVGTYEIAWEEQYDTWSYQQFNQFEKYRK